MPKICIGVFSHVLMEKWINDIPSEVITKLESACGDRLVYKINAEKQEVAVFVPHVGAPGAVGCFEELVAKSVEKFIFIGSCGVLQHDIVDGHLIVPAAAIRDEGVSFHYAEASDEIQLNTDLVGLVCKKLEELRLPFVTGKAWTTDAFYRETKAKMETAKRMGAVCVDMECAALVAAAQFRNVPLVQFFWAADNLDLSEWDSRSLAKKGIHVSDVCMLAAMEIAKSLEEP